MKSKRGSPQIYLLFATVSLVAGCNDAQPAPPTVAPLKVTLLELERAYDANEAAAQKKYGGQPLEVRAIVKDVDLDLDDKPVIHLKTELSLPNTPANLTEAGQAKADRVIKDKTIVLLCSSVREFMGTPVLDGCDIAG